MNDITKRISAAANIAKKTVKTTIPQTLAPKKPGRKKTGEGRTYPITAYLPRNLVEKLQRIRAIAMKNGYFSFTQSSALLVALKALPEKEDDVLEAVQQAKDEVSDKKS